MRDGRLLFDGSAAAGSAAAGGEEQS
jgi:hypothetical protein